MEVELSENTTKTLQDTPEDAKTSTSKATDEPSSSTATRYRDSLNSERQMTADEALSLVVENKLSKNMYNAIRDTSLTYNCKLYPPYNTVLRAKKECCPSIFDMQITESTAAVKLQGLLDHTVQRILGMQKDVIHSLFDGVNEVNLFCVWRSDGTSRQTTFEQKFDDGSKTDANKIFVNFAAVMPLLILSVKKSKQEIVWKNPCPSSPGFFRPLRIEFIRETDIMKFLDNQIEDPNLTPFQTIINGKEVTVTYTQSLTKVNGKMCNSLICTNSNERCYLCDCTLKEFSNIDSILKKPIKDPSPFAISRSEAFCTFFECLLHISYKLGVKKWEICGEDAIKIESRKRIIEKGFRQRLGLCVDQPEKGYGSTNDGNNARRFFENAQIAASITGLDELLIKRFHVVLQVLTCDFEVNIPKYKKYCLETAHLYVQLYPWSYMPITVHIILLHSGQMIEHSLLRMEQMSDETEESCEEFIEKYQHCVRKCDRVKNMEEMLQTFLVASDPVIASLRKISKKELKAFDAEAVELIKAPIYEFASSDSESEHSSDDEF